MYDLSLLPLLPQNKGQTVLIEQNIKITNTDRTVSRKVVVQKPKSRHDRRKKNKKTKRNLNVCVHFRFPLRQNTLCFDQPAPI